MAPKKTNLRTRILKSAIKKFSETSYERATIESIIQDCNTSKGGFYHHFQSKEALLQTIMTDYIQKLKNIVQKVVLNTNLNALEKIDRIIRKTQRFKVAQKDFNFMLIKIWQRDIMTIIRSKYIAIIEKEIRPLWQQVIEQGIEEGIFDTSYPEEVSQVISNTGTIFGNNVDISVFGENGNLEQVENVVRKIEFIEELITRLLGLQKGSIVLADVIRKNLEVFKKMLKDDKIIL